jgi:hypothetical protein
MIMATVVAGGFFKGELWETFFPHYINLGGKMLKKLTDKRKRLERPFQERMANLPPCYWKCISEPPIPRWFLEVQIYG